MLVAHPQNMTKITNSVLAEGGLHSGETSTSENFFVRNLLLPPIFENTTETSLV